VSRFVLDVAMGVVAFGAISIVVGGYNLLRMGPYIKPDTPTVQGFYVFPFGDEHFSDPQGKVYRDRCLRWFGAALASMLVFAILIVNTPNVSL
jgi:hypothetical protein